jgi:hypothetical protein
VGPQLQTAPANCLRPEAGFITDASFTMDGGFAA